MKANKVIVCALSAILLLSSCGMSNTAKGGLIGGGGGGALGALIGGLIGNGKGAAIGAGVGAAVGAGAGILIGNKMDKAKKAAEAAANNNAGSAHGIYQRPKRSKLSAHGRKYGNTTRVGEEHSL